MRLAQLLKMQEAPNLKVKRHSNISEEREEKIAARRERVISFVRSSGTTTMPLIAKGLGVPESTTRNDVKALAENGQLERWLDKKKNAFVKLNTK